MVSPLRVALYTAAGFLASLSVAFLLFPDPTGVAPIVAAFAGTLAFVSVAYHRGWYEA